MECTNTDVTAMPAIFPVLRGRVDEVLVVAARLAVIVADHLAAVASACLTPARCGWWFSA